MYCPGDELSCPFAKVRDLDKSIQTLRQQMAHLSLERSVIRPGLLFEPFNDPIIKVAYR